MLALAASAMHSSPMIGLYGFIMDAVRVWAVAHSLLDRIKSMRRSGSASVTTRPMPCASSAAACRVRDVVENGSMKEAGRPMEVRLLPDVSSPDDII
eukprot:scaffold19442_cov112-Isochrysis_galbana.AAC.5